MALYHVHVKTFSRGKGDSAIAACAYRLGVALRDDRTGRIHDYTKLRGIYGCISCAPDHAPTWARDPAACWQNAEAAEKRKDACVAREFELSLPRELTPTQNEALARDVVQHLVNRFGFAVTVGLHDFNTQPHAHILATTRKIGADGFGAKTRELDNRASGTVDEVRALISARTSSTHLPKRSPKRYASICLFTPRTMNSAHCLPNSKLRSARQHCQPEPGSLENLTLADRQSHRHHPCAWVIFGPGKIGNRPAVID